jgi:hypothetical protein
MASGMPLGRDNKNAASCILPPTIKRDEKSSIDKNEAHSPVSRRATSCEDSSFHSEARVALPPALPFSDFGIEADRSP